MFVDFSILCVVSLTDKGLEIFILRADILKIVSNNWYRLVLWYFALQMMKLPYFRWIIFFYKSFFI